LTLDLAWPSHLKHRPGAATRLDGIDVYYDFDWKTYFPDGRAQFRNGQCLAQNIRDKCPAGKTPALLLTDRDEADQGYEETPDHLVFVLNLPRYLATYADPSLAYLAHLLGDGVTRLGPLNEQSAERIEAGAAVIDAELDLERIAAWAANNLERKQQLAEIAGSEEGPSASPTDVLAAMEALGDDLDPEVVAAIGGLFGSGVSRESRLEMVRSITNDPEGRELTGEVLAERVPERIAEARNALGDYQALLADPGAGETALQEFIENNLWLLGFEYVKARPRHQIIRGTADFILERVDGFHDLLELKDPGDPIVAAPNANNEKPPPASEYSLSPALANALAQAHVYRDTLTTDEDAIERQFGLPHPRDPRLVVVLGRASSLPDHRLRVLRELNKSLHRVEVVPYDTLGDRARQTLNNIAEYLVAAEQEAATE
jgi:hypothetical protein